MDEEELIAALQELLGAARAGEQVGAMSAREFDDGPQRDHMLAVQAGQARWCAMLSGALEKLGAAPSAEVGAFYEKAIAIENPDFRLRFLNKGMDWVVRKLDNLVPDVEDMNLMADLEDMRVAHVAIIEATDSVLEATGG